MTDQAPGLIATTLCAGSNRTGLGHLLNTEESAANNMASEITSVQKLHETRYEGEVRRAALLLRSDNLAHDIVADAFCQVINRWDTINDPVAYLSRCVLNGCRKAAKQNTREQPSDTLKNDQNESQAAEFDEMSDAIAKLPWKQRAVIVLKFYEQLSEAEIADRLEIRPGSVGPTLARAKRRLEKEVAS